MVDGMVGGGYLFGMAILLHDYFTADAVATWVSAGQNIAYGRTCKVAGTWYADTNNGIISIYGGSLKLNPYSAALYLHPLRLANGTAATPITPAAGTFWYCSMSIPRDCRGVLFAIRDQGYNDLFYSTVYPSIGSTGTSAAPAGVSDLSGNVIYHDHASSSIGLSLGRFRGWQLEVTSGFTRSIEAEFLVRIKDVTMSPVEGIIQSITYECFARTGDHIAAHAAGPDWFPSGVVTITYYYAGGTQIVVDADKRTVTLTGGTWPTNLAATWKCVIDGTSYSVSSRTSGSVIVLASDAVAGTYPAGDYYAHWNLTGLRFRCTFNYNAASVTPYVYLHRMLIGTADEMAPDAGRWRRIAGALVAGAQAPLESGIANTLSNGIVAFVNQDWESSLLSQVEYSNSTDANHQVWSTPTALFTPVAEAAPDPGLSYGGMAVGFHGDTIVVATICNNVVSGALNNSTSLIIKTSTDGGVTWSAPITVLSTVQGEDAFKLVLQGKITRLSNGMWVFGVHTSSGAEAYFVHSTDLENWTYDTHTGYGFLDYEVTMTEVPGNKVFCLGRNALGFQYTYFWSLDDFSIENHGGTYRDQIKVSLARYVPGTSTTSDVLYDPVSRKLYLFLRGQFVNIRPMVDVYVSSDFGVTWNAYGIPSRMPIVYGSTGTAYWQSARFIKSGNDLMGVLTNRLNSHFLHDPNWFAKDYDKYKLSGCRSLVGGMS